MVTNGVAVKDSKVLGYDVHLATCWNLQERILFAARSKMKAKEIHAN